VAYKDPEALRAYQREYKRKQRAENPERLRELNRESHAAHRDERLAAMQSYREGRRTELAGAEQARRDALTPEQKQDAWLRRRYKISLADYMALSEAQGNKCAICGRPQDWTSWRTRLFVDHCHETGAVRGLLCSNCNKGIGMFGESTGTVRAALEYMTRRA
jgi:hypothetical protein